MTKRVLSPQEKTEIRERERAKILAKDPKAIISNIEVADETDENGEPVIRHQVFKEQIMPKGWKP